MKRKLAVTAAMVALSVPALGWKIHSAGTSHRVAGWIWVDKAVRG